MDHLDCLIQSLPQELQDNILDFTLLPAKADPVIINRHYKPPWQLQMNRRSRRVLIAIYYSQQVFHLSNRQADPTRTSWLRSLSPAALSAIRKVQVHLSIPFGFLSLFPPFGMVEKLETYEEALGNRMDALAQAGMEGDWLYTHVNVSSVVGVNGDRWMNVAEIRAMREEMVLESN